MKLPKKFIVALNIVFGFFAIYSVYIAPDQSEAFFSFFVWALVAGIIDSVIVLVLLIKGEPFKKPLNVPKGTSPEQVEKLKKARRVFAIIVLIGLVLFFTVVLFAMDIGTHGEVTIPASLF